MTRAEVRWTATWALVVMLLTCLPYLYVARLAPPGLAFSGLLSLSSDHCVYLAWEQQAAQGHFCLRNLFTGDPQRGIYIHLLCWLIGSAARLTGAPLIFLHHAARVLLGILTLLLAYRLFAVFMKDVDTRRVAFWFVALSAGFGWLTHPTPPIERAVVDLWQPEAVTFLTLYVNGLFCAALSLMLGIFLLLLLAEEQTGWARWSRVMGAGGLGLLLGNIHSYDVITVAAVWMAYVVVRAASERRFPGRSLADAAVAALLALPSILYQYLLYRIEPVFHMRANSLTLTAPLTSCMLGYGLVLLLAVVGVCTLVAVARQSGEALGQRLFPLTWSIVGFALPYLPFTFQRKLIMGLHLPLAFLAAIGAVALARWLAALAAHSAQHTAHSGTDRSGAMRSELCAALAAHSAQHTAHSGTDRSGAMRSELCAVRCAQRAQRAIVTVLLLLTTPSDWLYIRHNIEDAAANARGQRDLVNAGLFWPRADLEAMVWARRHLATDGVIFCATGSGTLFPAVAGRPVYGGHWSETPFAQQRMMEAVIFYRDAHAQSQVRRAFLEARHIRYVYQGTAERRLGSTDLARDPLFQPIYCKDGVTIFELRPRQARGTDSGRGTAG